MNIYLLTGLFCLCLGVQLLYAQKPDPTKPRMYLESKGKKLLNANLYDKPNLLVVGLETDKVYEQNYPEDSYYSFENVSVKIRRPGVTQGMEEIVSGKNCPKSKNPRLNIDLTSKAILPNFEMHVFIGAVYQHLKNGQKVKINMVNSELTQMIKIKTN
jgi:hypothetical protein